MSEEFKNQKCSGQFRLRIPKDLHAALAQEAQNQGVSMNSYVLYLLSTRHSQELVWQEAKSLYTHTLRHTFREIHEAVSSMTVGDAEPEGFSWRSTGRNDLVVQ